MQHFGNSPTSFRRDRFLVNSLMNWAFRLSSEVTSHIRPVSLPNCRAYVVEPARYQADRTIVYNHGGAMCFSMWKFYMPIAYQIAKNTKSRLILPEYRLSPEHPFPAALEDCTDALGWVQRNWGPRENVAIIGDSAGGNLALNLLCENPGASSLTLMSPWLDLTHSSESWEAESEDDVVFPIPARRAAWLYINGESDWTYGVSDPQATEKFQCLLRNPRISPLFRDLQLASRTPFLIQASRDERLLGDAVALWTKLGGNCPSDILPGNSPSVRLTHRQHEFSVWRNVTHVWQISRMRSRQAQEAICGIADFVGANYGT